ncbi:hypothetical protein FOA52_000208 [Chlamydomonas sp. UWO 241]|nr:hypothetical protein FOA52_000208 [Chlamydomonas sp. UWO 241]
MARPLRRAPLCRAQLSADASAAHKRAAAKLLVDTYIKPGFVLGLGSGELVNLTIAEVGIRIAQGRLNGVTAVPSCTAAAAQAAFNGVPLTTLEGDTKIDIGFEEVDQLDASANAAIMGTDQEPQQPQIAIAQMLACKAKTFVVLVNSENVVPRLKGTLPVVVVGETWEAAGEELDDVFIGDAELWRRSNTDEDRTNPRGGDDPYESGQGDNILDIRFDGTFKLFGEEESYEKILDEIEGVDGVVAHGLLLHTAHAAVVAKEGAEPELVTLKK